MSTTSELPLQQQQIRDRCFHPTGKFIEFRKEEIEQSVADRFEQQVRRYPNRLAIKTGSHKLTYDQANKTANRLAHTILAQRGKGQEPIALLLEQGAALSATFLSVLKAGKIAVSLDPSYPPARTSYMLEDSRAGLILTNDLNLPLAIKLAKSGIHILNIDEIEVSVSEDNLGLSVSPDTVAYILYTSGSTGEPKGVFRSHRGSLHHIMTYTNTLHICAEDRLTLLTSVSGQAMNTILNAWLNGAALFSLNIKEEGFVPLADLLIKEEITIYTSGSPLFRNFADTLTEQDRFPKVRLVRLASQMVLKSDVELCRKHFPNCIFVNGLSSSEAQRVLNYYIDKDTQITTSTVPVGFPLEDYEVGLLDDDGKEVGFNQVGEIAVKSRYLSLGYWGKPEKTREAFQPDPAGGDKRIYRMGDMGRMLSDGCLELLGRKDFQVKVRGYRVEIAEIEMALLNLETVKESAVVAQEDISGNQRLVAYIVPNGQPAPTVSELRQALVESMPDHMIPSAFVMLEVLPQTPNGKMDRLALPSPNWGRPELDSGFLAPRNSVEEVLVQIWADVLGLDQVGIDDPFLELGGDSLLASQVVARVIQAFQVDIPLVTLFEASTVAGMAESIATALWVARSPRGAFSSTAGEREEIEL